MAVALVVAVLFHRCHHVFTDQCGSLLVLRLLFIVLFLVLSAFQLFEFLCVFSHLLEASSSVVFVDLLLGSVLAFECGVIGF